MQCVTLFSHNTRKMLGIKQYIKRQGQIYLKLYGPVKKTEHHKKYFRTYFAELWAHRSKYNKNLIYFSKHKRRVTTFNTT